MTSPSTTAIEKIKSMQLLPLDAPILKVPDSAVYSLVDLPIKPIDPTASKKLSYTCVVEIVDLPEKPDVD
eukprot:3782922-Amphidinium_carterae.1